MKKINLLAVTLAILSVVVVASPVLARDGTSGSDDSSTTTQTTQSSSQTETTNETQTHQNEQITEAAKEKAEAARETAKKEAEQENETEQKSAEAHKKACEDRKHGLETKVENINKNAAKHLEHLNTFYEKALAYQKDNNVTVANWDQLVASADAAKVQATASVEALKQLQPTLDCTSGTVASDVANFKAAASQARSDLNKYRAAIKDIFTALETAKEGSNQ